ncbi:MAG: YdbL family protein [Desulfofustis sp.]|jgi:hypothetical protein|nr:YdbL family protein [Desulfofustis sp.]
MHNRIMFIAIVAAAALLLTGLTAPAASIKDRMLERIPAINALKDKGVIGENNRGYLEYRSADKPEQQLVNDENSDRKAVYQSIAQQQKVDSVLVGQRRAKQIADIGQKGHWFQKPDGTWYQK